MGAEGYHFAHYLAGEFLGNFGLSANAPVFRLQDGLAKSASQNYCISSLSGENDGPEVKKNLSSLDSLFKKYAEDEGDLDSTVSKLVIGKIKNPYNNEKSDILDFAEKRLARNETVKYVKEFWKIGEKYKSIGRYIDLNIMNYHNHIGGVDPNNKDRKERGQPGLCELAKEHPKYALPAVMCHIQSHIGARETGKGTNRKKTEEKIERAKKYMLYIIDDDFENKRISEEKRNALLKHTEREIKFEKLADDRKGRSHFLQDIAGGYRKILNSEI